MSHFKFNFLTAIRQSKFKKNLNQNYSLEIVANKISIVERP